MRHVVVLLIPPVVFATASADAQSLSLDQAVARGVAEHPAIEAASHRGGAAEDMADQAGSAWYPRLSFESVYRFSGPVPELNLDTGIDIPGAPSSISRELGTHHFASTGLRAGWRVYDFGSRSLRSSAAEANADAAQLEPDIVAADIAFAVRRSYLALAFASEVETTTERSLATARRELTDRENQREVGVGSELAVVAARSRVAELESRLVDVRQDKHIAEAHLRALLRIGPDEPLELSDNLQTVSERAAPPETTETPAMRRLAHLEHAAELSAEAYERSWWPTLDAFATGDYRYPRTFAETDEAGFNYAAGLSLTWLLFDGGLATAQRNEAKKRAAAASSAREALSDDLGREVIEARTRWDAAESRVGPARKRLEAAEDYLRAAQGARDAGATNTLDILRAEERVDMASLALTRAYFDKALARASWLRAQGISATDRRTP